MKRHYRTIVISDAHIGIENAKVRELTKFLKNVTCDKLIMNGDIIDAWQLRKSATWRKSHTRFVKMILKMAERGQTAVVYTVGNHDALLSEVLPFRIGSLEIVRDHVHFGPDGKRFFVCHGDVFDAVTSQFTWLARLGDVGYNLLLWLNRLVNNVRIRRGLPYYSFSRAIKLRVKRAVSFISDYETKLAELAHARKMDGIICGHIHQPAKKMIDGVLYLNSGDWVETLSALAEESDGTWSVIEYTDWLSRREEEKRIERERERAERTVSIFPAA